MERKFKIGDKVWYIRFTEAGKQRLQEMTIVAAITHSTFKKRSWLCEWGTNKMIRAEYSEEALELIP